MIKKLRGLVLIVLYASALVLSGCVATENRSSTGEYFDDALVTTKVKAALMTEPGLKDSQINVETYEGVVQLSGFISEQEDINTAIKIVKGVKGVVSVENDMKVRQ